MGRRWLPWSTILVETENTLTKKHISLAILLNQCPLKNGHFEIKKLPATCIIDAASSIKMRDGTMIQGEELSHISGYQTLRETKISGLITLH